MNVRQVFKGEVLTRTKTVNNIMRVLNDTKVETTGKDWYFVAHAFARDLAAKHNLTVMQVAGVIASLSPLKSWDENKTITKQFLRNGRAKHTGVMVAKAKDIINYKGSFQKEFILCTLNGNKIQNFFLNIAFPAVNDAVTIDRHAIAVALGYTPEAAKLKDITDAQYNFFLNCYKLAAAKAGILPHEIQAITWVKWRQLKRLKQFEDVPF